MALILAPYNSAMRLGMGFNSYTQSLCVNDVVRKPGNIPATEGDLRARQLTANTDAASKGKQLTLGNEQIRPQAVLEGASGSVSRTLVDGQKEVSQVVSWEATFINNSSEILEKLDVSGALTIKMASLGKLSGHASFVDSTDIKTADVNYLIHVKVTNQRLVADNITEFAPIGNIEPGRFTEIYGDCFISGFIEGGEFDALISITTDDTIKKWNLSGGLELEAKIGGIDVEGSVKGGKTDDKTTKKAKTKISVKWSGGGDIRDDKIKEWTLENLREIAMAFPDAVAACPQRISAILTKYTSLRSYHEHTIKGSPLDYENAGVYTASLYDAYTDYKMMWKELQTMLAGLNKKELALYMQGRSPSLDKYAALIAAIDVEKNKEYTAAIEAQKAAQDSNALMVLPKQSQEVKHIEKPLPANKVQLYDPDVFGLETAAADCRFEMIKIVREVDAVTEDPKVACDPTRVSQYLSPNVFRLLLPTPHKDKLPTMDEWTETKKNLKKNEDEVDIKKQEIEVIKKELETAMITPRRAENEALSNSTAADTAKLHPRVQTSLSQHAYRAGDYRMQTLLKDKNTISTGSSFFNDLDNIKPGARPSEVRLWSNDKKITGICIAYTSGNDEIANGKKEGNSQHVLPLFMDEVITEIEVYVTKTTEDKLSVTYIAFATSKCNILTAGIKPSGGKTYNFSMADYSQWSFRGFFGFTFDEGFEDLGIVWGKDIVKAATSTVQMPPAKNLLGMSTSLQEKTKKTMAESKPAEHFYLGDCISTGSTYSSPANSFSALDSIVAASKISKMAFSVSAGRLSGLKIDYSDGKQLTHGAYTLDREIWNCEVNAPIVAAKLTVGKTINAAEPFVDTVELVCGDANGELPIWPLDVSTIRYLGDHTEADHFEVVSKLAEQAPKLARANWTLRGFYGEENQGVITRLGLIWGCS